MPKLIDDWRQSWRFLSLHAAAALAALSLIQANVVPYVQPLVPEKYWPWVSLGMALLIGFFRLLAQNAPAAQEPTK